MRSYVKEAMVPRGGIALTAQGSELIDKILTSNIRTPKSTPAIFGWPRASMCRLNLYDEHTAFETAALSG